MPHGIGYVGVAELIDHLALRREKPGDEPSRFKLATVAGNLVANFLCVARVLRVIDGSRLDAIGSEGLEKVADSVALRVGEVAVIGANDHGDS